MPTASKASTCAEFNPKSAQNSIPRLPLETYIRSESSLNESITLWIAPVLVMSAGHTYCHVFADVDVDVEVDAGAVEVADVVVVVFGSSPSSGSFPLISTVG